MADFVFNIAKGKVAEKVADGATIKALVLKASDTDAVMKDYDTIAALLGDTEVTEADFTNYARPTLASLVAAVDDTGDRMTVDAADLVFTAAGGAVNNTTTDLVIYEDVDATDANAVPLCLFDAVFTTDGNDVTLQLNADGFFTAS